MKNRVGGCASRILLCYTLFLLCWYRQQHLAFETWNISPSSNFCCKISHWQTHQQKDVFWITFRQGTIWLSYSSVLFTDDPLGIIRSFIFDTKMLLMTCSSKPWLLTDSLLCWLISQASWGKAAATSAPYKYSPVLFPSYWYKTGLAMAGKTFEICFPVVASMCMQSPDLWF